MLNILLKQKVLSLARTKTSRAQETSPSPNTENTIWQLAIAFWKASHRHTPKVSTLIARQTIEERRSLNPS